MGDGTTGMDGRDMTTSGVPMSISEPARQNED
jgi:hypothetical protein